MPATEPRTGTKPHGSSRDGPPRRWRETGLAGLSYVLVFGAFNLQWIVAAADQLPISHQRLGSDTRLVVWIFRWVYTALTSDPTGILDAPINHPLPNQLTASDHFLTSQIVFAPIYAVTGNPLLGLNGVLLVAYPLAGLAMYCLLRAFGLGVASSWAAGLAFVLSNMATPVSVHHAQTLELFFPLVALTLLRLRETGATRWRIGFGLALVLGLLSSFYLAAMLLLSTAVWIHSEYRRPLPERNPFLARAGSALALGFGMLVVSALPYFGRSEVWIPSEATPVLEVVKQQSAVTVLSAYTLFGPLFLLAGLLGLVAATQPDLRRLVVLGATILGLAVAFGSGAMELLAALPLPGTLGQLADVPARFFRMFLRFLVLGSFGLALLIGAGFELLSRRLPTAVAVGMIALLVVPPLVGRGTATSADGLVALPSWDQKESEIYKRVAGIIAEHGDGPLLELPRFDAGRHLEAESMIGSFWHGQRLLLGHSGYVPPEREEINALVYQIPEDDALEEIIRRTGMRWLLVRAAAIPRGELVLFLDALKLSPYSAQSWWVSEGWFLFLIQPPEPPSG